MRLRLLFMTLLCCTLAESVSLADTNVDYMNLLRAGKLEYRSGHFAAAEPLFLDALQLLQPNDEVERATLLSYLGNTYIGMDELSKAEHVYLESWKIFKRHHDQQATILVLRNLGTIYSIQRRAEEASHVLNAALKLTNARTSIDGAITSEVLNSLGLLYYWQGRIGRAETFFTRAINTMPGPAVPFNMAEFLHNLGAVYMAQHKWNKAEEFLQRSFNLKQAEVGASHPDLSMTLRLLGDLYTRTRRYSEAENQYNQALTLLETAGVEFETRIARILEALGDMYEAAGRKMEANVPFSRAAAIGVRHLDKPDMSAIVEKHAAKLRKAGRSKEASDLEVEVNHARSALGLVINVRDRF